jgi:hypothetical protein
MFRGLIIGLACCGLCGGATVVREKAKVKVVEKVAVTKQHDGCTCHTPVATYSCHCQGYCHCRCHRCHTQKEVVKIKESYKYKETNCHPRCGCQRTKIKESYKYKETHHKRHRLF